MKILTKIYYYRLNKIHSKLDLYLKHNGCRMLNKKIDTTKWFDYFRLSQDDDISYDDYEDTPTTCSKKQKEKINRILANRSETFSSMLLRMIDEKKLKDSVVYKRANVDRRLFSKIRSNIEYVPSKKTAISFCLALRLNIYEAKELLKTAGYTLSKSSKFDLIIMYLLENGEYNINFANIVLNDYGEGSLSK